MRYRLRTLLILLAVLPPLLAWGLALWRELQLDALRQESRRALQALDDRWRP